MPEFRAFITIPALPFTAEDTWEPLAAALERDHAERGPILNWEGEDLQVVLSMAAEDQALAVRTLVGDVTDALRAAGLGDRYPSAFELEAIAGAEHAATGAG